CQTAEPHTEQNYGNPARWNRRVGEEVRRNGCLKRLSDPIHDNGYMRLSSWRDLAPLELAADADEQQERNQELERTGQPQPVPRRCAVVFQCECQQSGDTDKYRRLPQVVRQRREVFG